MKVLFINPPYLTLTGIKESGGHAVPLNLLYLASYLRDNIECKIKVLDAEILGLSFEAIKAVIKKENPEIIGITSPTPAMGYVAKIAKLSKENNPECIIVVGGAHPTACPTQTAKMDNIDFVVIGEGEQTLLELLKAIESGKKSFEDIGGLAFKSEKGVVTTKPRSLIQDLDSLPFPARDLIDIKLYHSAPTKKVSSSAYSTGILTSRGCPYDCIHCISKVIWHRKVRFRSANNIVDEIEECVAKYGIKEYNFYDDTFVLIEDRVVEVCNEIRKRGLAISWICFGRANTITRRALREMKKAGCQKISFGLESGSSKILDTMRKKITLKQSRDAVKMAREEGLEVHASFMLGNIGETKETIGETINFAKSLDLDNATFFITCPYPGTELYDIAVEKGYINENTAWEDFAPLTNSSPILVQDNLCQEELTYFQKRAFREFYLRPKYIVRKLKKVRSISDIKSLIVGLQIFVGLSTKS